jgi:hypothetical protein
MREWEKALPELIEEAVSMARNGKITRKEKEGSDAFIVERTSRALQERSVSVLIAFRSQRLSREALRAVILKGWNGATRSRPLQNAVAFASFAQKASTAMATRWRLRRSVGHTNRFVRPLWPQKSKS